MSNDFEEVYAAPVVELQVLRASLGALGYDTLLADENIKMWDPFVTTGYIFGSRLMAPSSRASEVRQTIQELKDDAPIPDELVEDDSVLALEEMGSRIRWHCFVGHCFVGITAPLGVISGVRYLRRCRLLSVTPRGHVMTLAGIAGCTVQCGLILMAVMIIL